MIGNMLIDAANQGYSRCAFTQVRAKGFYNIITTARTVFSVGYSFQIIIGIKFNNHVAILSVISNEPMKVFL